MASPKNKVEEPAANTEGAPRHYLYVVECADGTWYTGYTTNVEERIKAHNAGLGAKYTRSRGPVKLIAQAEFTNKHDAMSAEYHFKRLKRKRKERLVQQSQTKPFAAILRETFFRRGEEG